MIKKPKRPVRKPFREAYEYGVGVLEYALREGCRHVYRDAMKEELPEVWTHEQLGAFLKRASQHVSLEYVLLQESDTYHKVNGELVGVKSVEFEEWRLEGNKIVKVPCKEEEKGMWQLSPSAANLGYYVGLFLGEGIRQAVPGLEWAVDHKPSYASFAYPILEVPKKLFFCAEHVGGVIVMDVLLGVDPMKVARYSFAKWIGEIVQGNPCTVDDPRNNHIDIYPSHPKRSDA
jgi:hypothetical protein